VPSEDQVERTIWVGFFLLLLLFSMFLSLYGRLAKTIILHSLKFPGIAPYCKVRWNSLLVHVARYVVFCIMFWRSLFVFCPVFLLAIALSVFLRFKDSDYPFGIFKLFLIFQRSFVSLNMIRLEHGQLYKICLF
jgi:hypothetical protein